MVRKWSKVLVLAAGLTALEASALGLGEITTRSNLNQLFDAEIDLLEVPPGELEGIKIRLASPEAFARAGVDRPFSLTKLKFAPVRRADGTPAVKVTSVDPVREPFLNFLIEVNWPRGRLVREYTVLLDPPTLADRRPAQISVPRAQPKPTPVVPPAPPVAAPAPKPVVAQPAPAPRPKPVSSPRPAKPAPAKVTSAPGEYGPVKSGETLWKISEKVRPQGASIEQTMIALQRANPQAFINQNVNLLKKGKILRVPGREEIVGIEFEQARSEYLEQVSEWLAGSGVDKPAKSSATMAKKASGSSRPAPADRPALRVISPRPEADASAGAAEDDASRELVKDLRDELLLAMEDAESSRQQAQELRDQMSELEGELENMQRLVTVKDEQLARLQNEIQTPAQPSMPTQPAAPLVTPEAAPAPVDSMPMVDEIAAEPAEAMEETAEPVEADDETVIDPAEIATDYSLPAPIGSSESAESAMPAPPAPAVAEEPRTLKIPKVEMPSEPIQLPDVKLPRIIPPEPAAPPVTTSRTKRDEGGMFSDPLVLGGLGVLIAAILGGVGYVFAKKRKAAADEAEDEIGDDSLMPDMESQDVVSEENISEDVDEGMEGSDTSFLSEFSPSDINALQDETGEVDPVSEADVYIAYGRYQQAEELLRQAQERDPSRLALKHKLLEVHYATRDVAGFTSLAEEMSGLGEDSRDSAAWDHVREMGRDLNPEHKLFAGAGGDGFESQMDTIKTRADDAAALVGGDVGGSSDDGLGDDLDIASIDALDDELQEVSDLGTGGLDLGGDDELDLSLDVDELAEGNGLDIDAEGDLDSIQLDLDAPDLTAGTETGDDDDVLSLDLDGIGLPGEDEAANAEEDMDDLAITPAIGEADEDLAIDLDTGKLGELDDEAQVEEAVAAEGLDEQEIDLDSVLDLESDLTEGDLEAELDELSDLSALDAELSQLTDQQKAQDVGDGLDLGTGGMDDDLDDIAAASVDADEVDTKLDLAEAFLEMGDAEGARSILEEVQKEGNAEQQSRAAEFLAKLS